MVKFQARKHSTAKELLKREPHYGDTASICSLEFTTRAWRASPDDMVIAAIKIATFIYNK